MQEQRDDLLRTVSHGLRNPLTIILGHAQNLLRTMDRAGLTGVEHRSAEAILTSTRRMNTMIQDLVDSVRVESGQLLLQKQPVDLRAFVPELLDRSTGIIVVERIKAEVPANLPLALADLDRLERIFTNLLTNALKHSRSGTPVMVGPERLDNEVMVSVTDRAVGIAPEDLPHISERFYTVKGGRRVEGVGLGLHITKMLVEAHSGHV